MPIPMTLIPAMVLLAAVVGGCAGTPIEPDVLPAIERTNAARPPFTFGTQDEQLLDEVQRGAFQFLWKAGEGPGLPGMVPDRTSKPTVSVAGVGFQLSALCIGVERGWITRAQGEERAISILRALQASPDNRKAGLFFHFIHPRTAGQPDEAYEHVVSTVDSGLLLAGVLTASEYFGGEVAQRGDALFDAADWRFFLATKPSHPYEAGYISLGWKPKNPRLPTGAGDLLPYVWIDSGDEHRLVTFLAVCAPQDQHRVDPALYYRLRRQLGEYGDGPLVWFPWSGALFTAQFAHCWLDYAGMSTDDPGVLGVERRARVDWWENSRRLTNMHRRKATENPKKLPGLGTDAWGLTASDVPGGYGVPGLFPRPLPMPGSRPDTDYAVFDAKDDFGDGTLAPYGAGASIMFEPEAALAALRRSRTLGPIPGQPPIWDDPSKGGFGLADAYNPGKGWVDSDHLAIDQGPLLLAIENARTGLIWRTFHRHRWVREGMARLHLTLSRAPVR